MLIKRFGVKKGLEKAKQLKISTKGAPTATPASARRQAFREKFASGNLKGMTDRQKTWANRELQGRQRMRDPESVPALTTDPYRRLARARKAREVRMEADIQARMRNYTPGMNPPTPERAAERQKLIEFFTQLGLMGGGAGLAYKQAEREGKLYNESI